MAGPPDAPPDVLDAGAVRRWACSGRDALARAREEIDALNVYPVPDRDTGTNLYLTMEAAAGAVDALPPDADLAATVRTLARGALLGARGNSGIILSQLLRGMATTMAEPRSVAQRPAVANGAVLAAALTRAARMGYAAVARPVDGTILSVVGAAAQAAERAAEGTAGALAEVARDAARAAHVALTRTPDQLEVLARAGVVDAGGRGLTVLLDALAAVLTGVSAPPATAHAPVPAPAPGSGGPVAAPVGGPAYEVMYLLDAPDRAVPPLRAELDALGDCVVVVGGDGLWNVHAHVDDIGAALEAGVAVGRPHRIRVTDLRPSRSHADDTARRGTDARDPGQIRRAVVPVVAGEGLARLYESSGAAVVRGAAGRRVSTADLLDGITRAGAREVVVLPDHPDSLAVAEAAADLARREGRRVAVVPTVATVQTLAAVAVHEPSRRFDEDVVAMTAAAAHTRHGALTIAASEAMTVAGPCRAGDVLGIVDGDVAVIGPDLAGVARMVVDRMLGGGGELVTLVTGEGAPAGLAVSVVAHVEVSRPDVDTVVHEGGQARYPLLIGVE